MYRYGESHYFLEMSAGTYFPNETLDGIGDMLCQSSTRQWQNYCLAMNGAPRLRTPEVCWVVAELYMHSHQCMSCLTAARDVCLLP